MCYLNMSRIRVQTYTQMPSLPFSPLAYSLNMSYILCMTINGNTDYTHTL